MYRPRRPVALSGCARPPAPHEAGGTVVGAGAGAIAGGIIGGALGGSRGTVVGAVTGAALGGLTGNAIGRDLDEQDRIAAMEAQDMRRSSPVSAAPGAASALTATSTPAPNSTTPAAIAGPTRTASTSTAARAPPKAWPAAARTAHGGSSAEHPALDDLGRCAQRPFS
ncbi:MAG: hypothetical protein H6872_08390 [Methylobacteriaceae bacterium]|nr:hypothetical protein [Methylobacteriaceae bacterium]